MPFLPPAEAALLDFLLAHPKIRQALGRPVWLNCLVLLRRRAVRNQHSLCLRGYASRN
jgi:hypothetical protein